jgi:nitroreductase
MAESLSVFKKIVRDRVSVQRFLKDALPAGKVEELLALSQRAPSSFNIQPFVAIVGAC